MLYNSRKVEDWLIEKYKRQLEKDPMSPDDFMMQLEASELAQEEWFADPIYDKYEDKAYIDFVQGGLSCSAEDVLIFIIEVSAMEAISDFDIGHLETAASEWIDRKEEAKDPYAFRGLSRRDFH